MQKAIYKPENIPLALKSINIYDKSKRQQLKNDLKVLPYNDCNFLVRFYGAFFYEGQVKLAIEYMDLGSLGKNYVNIRDRVISKCREKKNLIPEIVVCIITQKV